MSTTAFLFEAIKAHLRSRSLTYTDLAGGLGVSEGTVKRMFSRKRCSTTQLDAICEFLQLDLPDLVRTLPRSRKLLERLTWQQEEEVTGDIKLFVVAVCALHLLRVEELLQVLNVRVSDASRVSLLSRLRQVAEAYNEQHVADADLPLAQRHPLSVWLAVRAWEPRMFKALRRPAPARQA